MNVADAIDAAYAAEPAQPARDYIGASGIGSECDAYLAFSLRGFPDTPAEPRLKRIFSLGHQLENMVVADLKKAGFVVWEKDHYTGRQWSYEAYGGHVAAHADGHIEIDNDERAILEIKSMGNGPWEKFQQHGIKISHPKYWWQMQMMMGMSGMRRALMVAYNKNTSAYHSEMVERDQTALDVISMRVEVVLRGEARKIAKSPGDWRCRGCFKRGACWDGLAVARRCQSCQHAGPQNDGGWWCRKHQKEAVAACGDWQRYEPKPA